MFGHVPVSRGEVTAAMFMLRYVSDALRAIVSAGALVMAGWLSVGIRPVTPMLQRLVDPIIAQQMPLPPQETIPDFFARESGAFALLGLVLFYYRRDWRDLSDYKGQRETVLMELIRENTKAATEMSAALRENNVVVHQAKNVLATYVGPAQRAGDSPRV